MQDFIQPAIQSASAALAVGVGALVSAVIAFAIAYVKRETKRIEEEARESQRELAAKAGTLLAEATAPKGTRLEVAVSRAAQLLPPTARTSTEHLVDLVETVLPEMVPDPLRKPSNRPPRSSSGGS